MAAKPAPATPATPVKPPAPLVKVVEGDQVKPMRGAGAVIAKDEIEQMHVMPRRIDVEKEQRGAAGHTGSREHLLPAHVARAGERERDDAEAGRIGGTVAQVFERLDDGRDVVAPHHAIGDARELASQIIQTKPKSGGVIPQTRGAPGADCPSASYFP